MLYLHGHLTSGSTKNDNGPSLMWCGFPNEDRHRAWHTSKTSTAVSPCRTPLCMPLYTLTKTRGGATYIPGTTKNKVLLNGVLFFWSLRLQIPTPSKGKLMLKYSSGALLLFVHMHISCAHMVLWRYRKGVHTNVCTTRRWFWREMFRGYVPPSPAMRIDTARDR